MSKRKGLSKTVRFEVFKRDSFTCQYCGAKAPEAILEVDHVKPVAEGGGNDLLNLVTSCRECNSGKGPRELSDDSAIEKQRRQLEELNERRAQLEMMIQWRDELNSLDDAAAEAVSDRLRERTGYGLNDAGKQDARKWIKKFGLAEVLEALEAAFDQYAEYSKGKITDESWEVAWRYIPRILSVRVLSKEKPHLRELFYVRGILRNRLNYVNDRECLQLLEEAYERGASIEGLKDFAKAVRNWTEFRDEINKFIDQMDEEMGA